MNYNEFIKTIKETVNAKLGEGMEAIIIDVSKNNGIHLDGLIFRKSNPHEFAISPIFYLNEFYERRQDYNSLDEITDEIISIYHEKRVSEAVFDNNIFSNFEKAKPKLYCKIINYDKNAALLETVPHKRILDLAVVVYYEDEDDNETTLSTLVSNNRIELWKTSIDDVIRVAASNTIKRSCKCVKIMELLTQFGCEKFCQDIDEEFPMFVLYSKEHKYGAVYFTFNHIMEAIAEKLQSDVIIFPSSIYEVIMVPYNSFEDLDAAKLLVRNINKDYVNPEEVLSDNVYLYKRELHELVLVN